MGRSARDGRNRRDKWILRGSRVVPRSGALRLERLDRCDAHRINRRGTYTGRACGKRAARRAGRARRLTRQYVGVTDVLRPPCILLDAPSKRRRSSSVLLKQGVLLVEAG